MSLLGSGTCTVHLISAPDQLGRKPNYIKKLRAYYHSIHIVLSAHFIFASCHITFQCGYVALRNAVFEPILVAPVSKMTKISMYISNKSTIHCIFAAYPAVVLRIKMHVQKNCYSLKLRRSQNFYDISHSI